MRALIILLATILSVAVSLGQSNVSKPALKKPPVLERDKPYVGCRIFARSPVPGVSGSWSNATDKWSDDLVRSVGGKRVAVLIPGTWSNVDAEGRIQLADYVVNLLCPSDIDQSAGDGERFFAKVIGISYHWNASPKDNGLLLADRLRPLVESGARIYLYCHSQGGLLARVAIELSSVSDIKTSTDALIMFGTPNEGIPRTAVNFATAFVKETSRDSPSMLAMSRASSFLKDDLNVGIKNLHIPYFTFAGNVNGNPEIPDTDQKNYAKIRDALGEDNDGVVGISSAKGSNIQNLYLSHWISYEANITHSFLLNVGDFKSQHREKLDEWLFSAARAREAQMRATSTISLVIDRSGSMDTRDTSGFRRWDAAVEAAKKLLRMLETEGTAFGVKPLVDLVFFDGTVETPISPTTDYASLMATLDAAAPRNNTNITDALITATQRLQDPRYDSMSKSIVLLSDGVHNATFRSPADGSVLQSAIDSQIKIYTVGLGSRGASDYDENTLRAISDQTGGQFYAASDTYNLSSVFLSARHNSMGQSLYAQQGVFTAPGKQSIGNFDPSATQQALRYDAGAAYAQVPPNSPALLCSLNYDTGNVGLILKDPEGKQVDATYPDATIVPGQPALAIVKNPKPGKWEVLADPTAVPPSGIRYSFEASGRADKPLLGGGGGGVSSSTDWLTGALVFSSTLVLVIACRLVYVSRQRFGMTPLTGGYQITLSIQGQVTSIQDSTILGRSPRHGIKIKDDSVSTEHAMVFCDHGTWKVRDLNSRNGTRLNGERIMLATLRPGDTLQVGESVVRVVK